MKPNGRVGIHIEEPFFKSDRGQGVSEFFWLFMQEWGRLV